MNGPDLGFLAERSSVLEDRTQQRLGEVHARIAAARRRRRAGAAAGVAALVVGVATGLAVLDRGVDSDRPLPAPRPTPTADAGAVPAPARGTCWAVQPRVAPEPGHVSDGSPRVPCTEPHTTETVASFVLDQPTAEGAAGTSETCHRLARDYLGIDDRHWIPWWVEEYLPSEEQIAAGASWVRCDAGVPAQWTLAVPPAGLRTVTTSLWGIASAPPAELWGCLARPPTEDQPLVSCSRPHAYESTGTAALIHSMTTYPSAAERATEGQRQCRADVPRRLAGADVTVLWAREDSFDPPVPVSGLCFVHRRNGDLLPAR